MLFKKNLDLMYKVKGSGMMKAGKLSVSAIFRPVPSVVKSGQCKYLSLVPFSVFHALARDIEGNLSLLATQCPAEYQKT